MCVTSNIYSLKFLMIENKIESSKMIIINLHNKNVLNHILNVEGFTKLEYRLGLVSFIRQAQYN